MGHSQPLFRLLLSFQTNITIFTTITCEKISIQYMLLGSEPTPSEHKYPPITTRPGLPYLILPSACKINTLEYALPLFVYTTISMK